MIEKKNEFLPNWTSPPGDTIKECMEHHHISIEQFAQRIGMDVDDVPSLLDGTCKIDEQLAQKLEVIFGPSKQFWINREKNYRNDLIRLGRSS